MKLIIKSQPKNKPFKGDDGKEINYFWYKAERVADEVTIDLGSKNGGYKIDEQVDLLVQKKPTKKEGEFRYTELSTK